MTASPLFAALFFAGLWLVVLAIVLLPERNRNPKRRTFTPPPRKRRKP